MKSATKDQKLPGMVRPMFNILNVLCGSQKPNKRMVRKKYIAEQRVKNGTKIFCTRLKGKPWDQSTLAPLCTS